jgi:hypothetical protein
MILLARVWRSWIDSWSSPGRARFTYAGVTLAFVALAVVAAVMREPAVAAVAGVVAVATAGIAIIAPRLAEGPGQQEERIR